MRCVRICVDLGVFFFKYNKVQLLMGHVFFGKLNGLTWKCPGRLFYPQIGEANFHQFSVLVTPTCLDPKLKKRRQHIFWTKWLTLW